MAFAVLAGLSLVLACVGCYTTLQAEPKRLRTLDDQDLRNGWGVHRKEFIRLCRLDFAGKILESISEVQLFNGTLPLLQNILVANLVRDCAPCWCYIPVEQR